MGRDCLKCNRDRFHGSDFNFVHRLSGDGLNREVFMKVLTNGQPVPDDNSHTQIDPVTGQQKAYVVLSDEERAKGFVRPVRRSYVHNTCGTPTTMGQAIAETYARNPKFYSGTFCCNCGEHFPLSEFVWAGTKEIVGS
jgi:hypothetical protein